VSRIYIGELEDREIEHLEEYSNIISIVNIATSVDIIKGKLSKKGKIFSISSVPITLFSIGIMLFAIIYCSMFGLI